MKKTNIKLLFFIIKVKIVKIFLLGTKLIKYKIQKNLKEQKHV